MFLDVGPCIKRILGLTQQRLQQGQTSGTTLIDLNPTHTLYVYCDIVKNRIVGDKMTQLLRVVPVIGEDEKMCNHIYENIHYIPLLRKVFDTIEIDIRDSRGQPVPFEGGSSNVTLHFR